MNVVENVKSNLQKWNTSEVLSKCLSFIDLTTLNPTDTYSKVETLVKKVNDLKNVYPNASLPASICVYPNFAQKIKSTLNVEGVNITVVSGCFPASQSFLEVKILETKLAVENGADEVDIVLALNNFLDGNYDECTKEISEVKKVMGQAHLKVILETGALTPEQIKKASWLAMEAGADFIKTSTGKIEPAATPEAAEIMCLAIKEYYEKTGKKIGFKPAGGIVTYEDALTYYGIVDTILGSEWLNKDLLRFGASRAANNILSRIENDQISYF